MAERTDSRESQDDSDQVGGLQGQACEPCKKKNKVGTATMFCADCKEYQCDKCCKAHEIFKAMSGHEVVKAEDALSIERPIFDMKGLDKCKGHDEILKFYCVDEQKVCCNTCAITKHRGCAEVTEICDEAKKRSVSTSGVESIIQELQDAARNLVDLLEKTKASTCGKLESVLDYIDGIKRTLNSTLDQIKSALTEQFQSLENKRLELLNTSTATAKSISEDLNEKQEYLKTAKSCGTQDQLFIANHVITNQIIPYKSTLKEQSASLYTVDCSFGCNENLQEILKSNVNLATFSVDKIPIDPLIPPVEKSVQPQLVKSVDVKQGKDDTEEPLYSGMDFLPDGRLVVVDNPNKHLLIINENLEKKGMHKLSCIPLHVCVVSMEEVALTSDELYFFYISKTNDITLTRIVKTTAQYVSICLMNGTTFLVSTIDDKRPLRMITLTGEEEEFDNLPEKQYKIDDSASTYMRNKDIAVFTDRFEHTVCMYDVKEKGRPRHVVKHDDIKEPSGVCVGPGDCLFVCCKETNSIVQISPSGKVVATYTLDMWYPRIVCVSKDGRRMAVSNSAPGNLKFQLFHLLG